MNKITFLFLSLFILIGSCASVLADPLSEEQVLKDLLRTRCGASATSPLQLYKMAGVPQENYQEALRQLTQAIEQTIHIKDLSHVDKIFYSLDNGFIIYQNGNYETFIKLPQNRSLGEWVGILSSNSDFEPVYLEYLRKDNERIDALLSEASEIPAGGFSEIEKEFMTFMERKYQLKNDMSFLFESQDDAQKIRMIKKLKRTLDLTTTPIDLSQFRYIHLEKGDDMDALKIDNQSVHLPMELPSDAWVGLFTSDPQTDTVYQEYLRKDREETVAWISHPTSDDITAKELEKKLVKYLNQECGLKKKKYVSVFGKSGGITDDEYLLGLYKFKKALSLTKHPLDYSTISNVYISNEEEYRTYHSGNSQSLYMPHKHPAEAWVGFVSNEPHSEPVYQAFLRQDREETVAWISHPLSDDITVKELEKKLVKYLNLNFGLQKKQYSKSFDKYGKVTDENYFLGLKKFKKALSLTQITRDFSQVDNIYISDKSEFAITNSNNRLSLHMPQSLPEVAWVGYISSQPDFEPVYLEYLRKDNERIDALLLESSEIPAGGLAEVKEAFMIFLKRKYQLKNDMSFFFASQDDAQKIRMIKKLKRTLDLTTTPKDLSQFRYIHWGKGDDMDALRIQDQSVHLPMELPSDAWVGLFAADPQTDTIYQEYLRKDNERIDVLLLGSSEIPAGGLVEIEKAFMTFMKRKYRLKKNMSFSFSTQDDAQKIRMIKKLKRTLDLTTTPKDLSQFRYIYFGKGDDMDALRIQDQSVHLPMELPGETWVGLFAADPQTDLVYQGYLRKDREETIAWISRPLSGGVTAEELEKKLVKYLNQEFGLKKKMYVSVFAKSGNITDDEYLLGLHKFKKALSLTRYPLDYSTISNIYISGEEEYRTYHSGDSQYLYMPYKYPAEAWVGYVSSQPVSEPTYQGFLRVDNERIHALLQESRALPPGGITELEKDFRTLLKRKYGFATHSETAKIRRSDELTDEVYIIGLKKLKRALDLTRHVRDLSIVEDIYISAHNLESYSFRSGSVNLRFAADLPAEMWIKLLSAQIEAEPTYLAYRQQEEEKINRALQLKLSTSIKYYVALRKLFLEIPEAKEDLDKLKRNKLVQKIETWTQEDITLTQMGWEYGSWRLRFESRSHSDITLEIDYDYKGVKEDASISIGRENSRSFFDNNFAVIRLDREGNLHSAKTWGYEATGNLAKREWLNSRAEVIRVAYTNREVLQLTEIYSHGTANGRSLEEILRVSQRRDRVLVTILDSGIDYNHPAIAYKIPRDHKTIGWDFNENDDKPYDYEDSLFNWSESYDHGTHVAGIASRDSDDIAILPLRYPRSRGDGFYEAIEMAHQRGSRIVNISLGGNEETFWDPLERAIRRYPDMLFIVAAGNEEADLDREPHYPAAYNYPNMLKVASLNSEGELSKFSNYSATLVNVAAPGEDIISLEPEGASGEKSGTSMATPFVTRIAAKIKFINPRLDPTKIIDIIERASENEASLIGKVKHGILLNDEKALALARETL